MKEVESAADEKVVPTFYAILPLLPLVLIIIVGIIGIFRENVTMDIFCFDNDLILRSIDH